MSALTVDLRGAEDVHELVDQLSDKELVNRTRRATRAGAKVFRQEVRSQAKSRSDLPSSFSRTATRNHRHPLGTSTGPTSPLLNIFEVGADDHSIGERGQFLHSGQGVSPVFAARGPVDHPGFDARPLIGPVFDSTHDEAEDAAVKALFEGIR